MAALTNPSAPGTRTSEFAATAGGSVGVGLLAMGIISADIVDPIVQLITMAISGAAAMFTIGWIIVNYVQGRKDVKKLLIEKGVIVQTQSIPTPEPPTPAPEAPTQG